MEDELDPKTFNTLEFIGGGNYPTEDVTVYTDQAAAYKISQLESELAAAGNDPESAEIVIRDINELKAKIKDSALVFHMRGVPQYILGEIAKKVEAEVEDETERRDKVTAERLAAHIVSVTNAKGQTDTRVWDAESMDVLDRYLPAESMRRLAEAMIRLSFKSTYFEEAGLDADF